MIGRFNTLSDIPVSEETSRKDIAPTTQAVAPQFDTSVTLCVETYPSSDGDIVRYTSDVNLLLHVKDLESRAGLGFVQRFAQNNNSPSAIQLAMDKMSDEELLSTVRSRYIQSPSEILAWSKMLAEEAENLEIKAKDIQQQLEAEKAAEASPETPAQ